MSDNTQGNWFDGSTPDPRVPQPGAQPAQQWAPPTQPPTYPAQSPQPPHHAAPAQPWGAPGDGAPTQSPNAGMQPMSETVEFGAESVEKKGGMAGRMAVIGLSVALVGGGAVALRSALSEPAGPGSAEDAAAAVFTAFEDEDFVGVIELMAPAEREAYVEPMLEVVQEISRLTERPVGDNIFADLPFEIEIDGLEYEVTQLGPGVSWVDVTAGQLDVTFVTDEIPAWADVPEGAFGTAQDMTESIDLANEEFEFAVVEDDGSWYWSAGYTAAESIREELDLPLPLFNGTELADGADTPEGAVQEAVDGLIDFDLKEAFTKLDPEEFGVLYDYSELFLDDAAQEFAAFESEIPTDLDYFIGGFEYSSRDVRGRTIVTIDAFEFSGSDGIDSISGSYVDGCLIMDINGDEMNGCEMQNQAFDELASEFVGLQNQILDIQERMGDDPPGITVVERGGKWYIAGGPTFFGSITDVLSVMTPDDIDELSTAFPGMIDILGASAEESLMRLGGGVHGTSDGYEDLLDDDVAVDDGASDILDEATEYGTYADFDVLDEAYLAPGYSNWPDAPEVSMLAEWFDVEVPLTVSNLSDEDAWVELAEFASTDIQLPVDAAVRASIYECGPAESSLPEGATLYTCADTTVVVTYGRWVLTSYGSEIDPLSPLFAAQIAHLQSLGE